MIGRSRTSPAEFTAASIFWFEAWGLMGFACVVMAPLVAFMHGTFPPSTWTDGSALRLLVLLVAVGLLSLATWLVGGRHPRLRGWVFLLLGLACLAGIGLALPYNPVVLLGVALWLGWPGVMLITVWGRFLRSPRPTTTTTAA